MSFIIPDTYELIKKEHIADLGFDGYILKHKKSGARVCMMPCDDTNKLFCIAFATPPEDSKGTYVRKERFTGRCSRSFYVGEDIEEADIKAKFDNGTLQITVLKKVEQPKLEEPHTIAIEG